MSVTPALPPRLLTDEQAADYCNVPLKAFRKDPIGRVVVCGKPRFDRFAIDAHLDNLSGLQPKSPSTPVDLDDAEAALARHKARLGQDASR